MLSRRRAGLALVVGAPGSGKSTLLARLEASAISQGWLVPRLYERELKVSPATDEHEFIAEVRGLLAGYAVYADALPGIGPYPQAAEESLIDSLGASGPTLLIVDDYRPSAQFAEWFERRFTTELKDTGRPVVVVLAARPGFGSDADDVANAVIRLGRLNEQAVRDAIRESAEHLEPPLDDRELKTYVETACDQPEILDGLLLLLQLASESTRRHEEYENHSE